MEMVRPLWRVDAPPVVILALEERLAPSVGGAAALATEIVWKGVVRRVRERRVEAATAVHF